jgi:hypothetical protein
VPLCGVLDVNHENSHSFLGSDTLNPLRSRLRNSLLALGFLAVMAGVYCGGYYVGYRAGLSDRGPQRRVLVVVRQTAGNSGSSNSIAGWFDISDPRDVAKLAKEERRLKALGANYYVAKVCTETTLSPEPDPRRVNSHR